MRCVSVLGPSQTGKTTLIEQLARLEGTPDRITTRAGLGIVRFGFMGEPWMALDCPGSIEGLGDTRSALMASDAAVLCVSPHPEEAVLAAPYIRAVEASGTPCLVFVNRMDEARERIRDIVAALQTYAEHVIVLRQIPIREGDRVVGAVDLVSERAWRYREGQGSALIEVPAALLGREREARGALLEGLSEHDDWLLEELVEDRTPASGPLYEICARALRENTVVEAFIGSAGHANGIRRLMKALRHETPQVATLRARLAAAGGGEAPLAVGFHAQFRQHVGKIVYLRALADGIAPGGTLGGGHLGTLQEAGGDRTRQGPLEPGAVAATVKSEHLAAGRPYTAAGMRDAPAWAAAPEPMVARILVPTRERDDVKLSSTLARLAEDDPGLVAGQEEGTGRPMVRVQGLLHLRALKEQLAEVFGIEVSDLPLGEVYRETITRPASVHHRHRKQTGGAGQFADVRLTVEPNPRGTGFTFAQAVKGGAVPRNYIPAVETGARDAMARGPLGFPVVDVGVTLTDGQHHSVDSSDFAFRTAARAGVQQALGEAVPVLLQPVFAVTFHVPSVFSGALVPIVSALRGQVLGFDRDPAAKGWDEFRALLPGHALGELTHTLRSATQGIGYFESAFDHYEELYGKEADKIVEAHRHDGPDSVSVAGSGH